MEHQEDTCVTIIRAESTSGNKPHEESTMEYPEEIYVTSGGGMLTDHFKNTGAGWGRRRAYKVDYGKGMTRGMISQLSKSDPLEGCSDLTATIKAGAPIDWEKLDGLKVKCVNPSMGELRGTLKRNEAFAPDLYHGWDDNTNLIYTRAFCHSWLGLHGWTLWVEGEVPMRCKTADQLEVGTYFRSSERYFGNAVMYVGNSGPDEEKSIHFTPSMTTSEIPASEWVVLEELGTFQKPEGKQ